MKKVKILVFTRQSRRTCHGKERSKGLLLKYTATEANCEGMSERHDCMDLNCVCITTLRVCQGTEINYFAFIIYSVRLSFIRYCSVSTTDHEKLYTLYKRKKKGKKRRVHGSMNVAHLTEATTQVGATVMDRQRPHLRVCLLGVVVRGTASPDHMCKLRTTAPIVCCVRHTAGEQRDDANIMRQNMSMRILHDECGYSSCTGTNTARHRLLTGTTPTSTAYTRRHK